MSMRPPKLGIVDFLGLLLCGVFFYSFGSLAKDPGVGWHLKTGEWIMDHGVIPSSDPFLFPDRAWVANQWAADVLLWLAYSLGGWELVHAASALVLILAFHVVTSFSVLRRIASAAVAFLVLLLICSAGSIQWIVRPVIFSFLFFAISIQLSNRWLEKPNLRRSTLLSFFLLFAVWANFHSAFPLGFLVVGALGLQYLRDNMIRGGALKEVLLLGSVCFLATALNPYGLGLHAYAIGLIGDPYFMNLNQEWMSPNLHAAGYGPITTLFALVFLLSPLALKNKAQLYEFIVLIVLFYLSLNSKRYLSFLALGSAGIIAAGAGQLAKELSDRICVTSFLKKLERTATSLFAGGSSYFYTCSALAVLFVVTAVSSKVGGLREGTFGPEEWMPNKSMAVFEQALGKSSQEVRVFHTPDFGGYFTYKYWPRFTPYIDDRNQLNGQKRYEEYFNIVGLKKNWGKALSDFDWVVLRPGAKVLSVLNESSDWKEVGRDRNAVLFRRLK